MADSLIADDGPVGVSSLDPSISLSPNLASTCKTTSPSTAQAWSLRWRCRSPGWRLKHSALPSWWDWRARRTGDGGSYIDLAMTLFDDDVDPPSFGGFNVTADCAPSEMFALWLALRREFAQVWLHSPDCRLHKPGSFSTEFV
jgi:hypothetical protein